MAAGSSKHPVRAIQQSAVQQQPAHHAEQLTECNPERYISTLKVYTPDAMICLSTFALLAIWPAAAAEERATHSTQMDPRGSSN
jgi:hypothetical protein